MHRAVGGPWGTKMGGIRSGDAHSLMGPVQEWKPRPGPGTCRVWASTFGFGGTHSNYSTTHAHAWYPATACLSTDTPHSRSHPEPLTTFSLHLYPSASATSSCLPVPLGPKPKLSDGLKVHVGSKWSSAPHPRQGTQLMPV